MKHKYFNRAMLFVALVLGCVLAAWFMLLECGGDVACRNAHRRT